MKNLVRLVFLISALASICHATTVVILYDGERILYGTDTRTVHDDGTGIHDDVCKAFLSDKYVISKVGFTGKDAGVASSGVTTEEYDQRVNQSLMKSEPPDILLSDLHQIVVSVFNSLSPAPPGGSVPSQASFPFVQLVYAYFDGSTPVANFAKWPAEVESKKLVLTKDVPVSPTHPQYLSTDLTILKTQEIRDPLERLKAILHRMHELDRTNIGEDFVIASLTPAGGKWIQDDQGLCTSHTYLKNLIMYLTGRRRRNPEEVPGKSVGLVFIHSTTTC
jgi:hypothetical protein